MRPLSPWSRPAPAPSPASHAIPASAPAHPRSVSPKPTSIGSPPPTGLHALVGDEDKEVDQPGVEPCGSSGQPEGGNHIISHDGWCEAHHRDHGLRNHGDEENRNRAGAVHSCPALDG